jgi:glycosyltransferase involved in cell wall biosynthesis
MHQRCFCTVLTGGTVPKSISIITVVRNRRDSIAMTLHSLHSQTHPIIQHVVVDGGSTDGTLDVLRAHARDIDVLVSEPDTGIYDALNKGLARITGDIVGVLHAGDVYSSEDVLASVSHAMEREPLDAVFGDVVFFDQRRPSVHTRRYRSSRFRPTRISWGWMPAHPALFVDRGVVERVGPYRTDFRIAGDFEWIARAFGAESIRYRHIPEVLVQMSHGGISTGGWKSSVLLNREVMRACRVNGISTNWFKILSKYPLKALEFVQP